MLSNLCGRHLCNTATWQGHPSSFSPQLVNNLHPDIKFTPEIENEKGGGLSFWVAFAFHTDGGSLGMRVYPRDRNWATNRIHRSKKNRDSDDCKGCVLLPSYGSSFSKIGRLIGKFHFNPIFVPLIRLRQLLHPAKVDLGLWGPGVDQVP